VVVKFCAGAAAGYWSCAIILLVVYSALIDPDPIMLMAAVVFGFGGALFALLSVAEWRGRHDRGVGH
jgi:hypothetical protein